MMVANVWGRNGPKLLTRVYHELMNKNGHADVNVVDYTFSDMIEKCFKDTKGMMTTSGFSKLRHTFFIPTPRFQDTLD